MSAKGHVGIKEIKMSFTIETSPTQGQNIDIKETTRQHQIKSSQITNAAMIYNNIRKHFIVYARERPLQLAVTTSIILYSN